MKKHFFSKPLIIVVSVILSSSIPAFLINAVYAWTEPTVTPPAPAGGSVPITTVGGQTIDIGSSTTDALQIKNDGGTTLYLENTALDKWALYISGNTKVASGNLSVSGSITSGTKNVCLSDGTNCPVGPTTYWTISGDNISNTSSNAVMVNNRLQIGNKSESWIDDVISGFTEPVVDNDAFLFVGGYTSTEDSDLRLYMLDNAVERFSIWGDSCGGGACGDINKASLKHYFTGGGNVYHSGNLTVSGAIYAANSDIYFTKTDHNHTGIGNTVGYAAIENATNYGALMILGRQTATNRVVKLWDYLQVNGNLDVVGTAMVNYLKINAQDGTNEGGELQLLGAGSYGTFQIDNYQGNARIHTLASGKQFQVLGGSIYADGYLRAEGGIQVDGYEMVGSNADLLYANRKNTTGGGIWISDDGGFYDYNNAYVDFRGSAGIRILESDGNWGDNSIRATNLCMKDDCRSSWPSGIGGSGTASQVAFFTAGTSIGSDSNLYWDNTNKRLGIGTTNPGSNKLFVANGDSIGGGLAYKYGSTEAMGVYGVGGSATTNYGLFGYGYGGTTAYGIYASAGGASTNWAGYFVGNIKVTGSLKFNPTGTFYTKRANQADSCATACSTDGNYCVAPLGQETSKGGTYLSPMPSYVDTATCDSFGGSTYRICLCMYK